MLSRLRAAGSARDVLARALAGPVHWWRPYGRWFQELARYCHGLTPEEFWVRYTLGRREARTLWDRYPRDPDEAKIRAFYAETDYWLYRQAWVHRRATYYWIARHLRGPRICEYGCGIAPVTAWLTRTWPWRGAMAPTLVDVPSPTFDFARWRLPQALALVPGLGPRFPLRVSYDGIVCLDVLEHVPEPLALVRHFVEHLLPGGILAVNFQPGDGGDENLTSAARQRPAVLAYLGEAMTPIRPIDPVAPTARAVYRASHRT